MGNRKTLYVNAKPVRNHMTTLEVAKAGEAACIVATHIGLKHIEGTATAHGTFEVTNKGKLVLEIWQDNHSPSTYASIYAKGEELGAIELSPHKDATLLSADLAYALLVIRRDHMIKRAANKARRKDCH